MIGAVLAGRRAAESLMLDSCIVSRPGGEPVWDENRGDYVAPAPVTVYEGRCKVQTRNVAVAEADAGEREIGVLAWEVHLPVDGTGGVTRGDTVEVTAAALDSSLVGRQFTVSGPHVGTAKTARRLPVEAVV